MTKARVRLAAVGGGLVLLVGLWIAPQLPPAVLLPISVAWLAVLIGLLWLGFQVALAWLGRRLALAAIVSSLAVLMLVTGTDWSGSLGTYLPCRRNWAWLPSYLLRSSPPRSVVFTVGRTRVKVCYGQPAARGRTMIGGPRVPFGELWRTGANEPTVLRASGPITVAGIHVPRGNVSLYTIPGPESWEVVINGATAQWGIESEYTPAVRAQELGRRVAVSRRAAEYRNRLVFSAAAPRPDSSELMLAWERTEVRIPVVARR